MFFHLYLLNITHFSISVTFILISIFLSLAFQINFVLCATFASEPSFSWLGFCGLLLLSASIITSIIIYIIFCHHPSSFLVYLITILMIYVSENAVFDIHEVVFAVIIILTSTFCPRVVSVS